MKKFMLVLFLILGISALVLAQFAFTPETQQTTLEWAVYAIDREAIITYSEPSEQGIFWMFVLSNGENYQVYLQKQLDGDVYADSSDWVFLMHEMSGVHIEGDYEFQLTVTAIASQQVQPTVEAASFVEICGQGEITIESGMTIHAARPPYEDTTYSFFYYTGDGWQIDVRVDGEFDRTESLAEISNMPFTWNVDGQGNLTVTAIRC